MMQYALEVEATRAMEKLGATGVKELGLRVLRDFLAAHPNVMTVPVNAEFVRPFFAHALNEAGGQQASNVPAELALDRMRVQPLLELIWWLIRTGYVIPVFGQSHLPVALEVTAAGAIFLAARTGDHPLLPSFVERLRQRCPSIPEEILAHLQDAKACLEHRLHRPAMVLIDEAYRLAIESLGEPLIQLGKLKRAFDTAKGWERINMLKHAIPNLGLEVDQRAKVARALDCAHTTRERRSQSSSSAPSYPYDEAAEFEEFLVSACRHLPSLWILHGVR